MADFNVNLSAPQAAGASVLPAVKPVDISPVANLASGLVSAFGKQMALSKKEEEEARNQAIVGEFTRSQTAINDGLASGTLSTSRATAMSRANFNKFSAAYPHLVEDFGKTNKSLFEHTELNEAEEINKAFQAAERAEINEMVQSGMPISRDMDPGALQFMREAHRRNKQLMSELELRTKRAAEARAVSSEERAAFDHNLKIQTGQLLSQIGSNSFQQFDSLSKELIAEVERGGDAPSAIAKLESFYAVIDRDLTAAAGLHPSLAADWRKMFEGVKKTTSDFMSGKVSREVYDNQYSEIESKSALAALNADPTFVKMLALSKLTRGNIPALFLDANKAAIAVNFTLKDGEVIVNRTPEEQKAATGFISNAIDSVRKGMFGDDEAEAKEQIIQGNKNVLSSIEASQVYRATPQKLKPIMDYVRSPQFGYAIENGLVPKEEGAVAIEVFRKTYESPLRKEINKKLSEDFVFGGTLEGKAQPFSSLVDVVFEGNGVTFKAIKDRPYMNQFTAQTHRQFINELNSSKKALNDLIVIGAHLSGTTDYKTYWEDNKHILLPDIYPDPKKLKIGSTLKGVDGKTYRYLGGNYNDIQRSYEVVDDGQSE